MGLHGGLCPRRWTRTAPPPSALGSHLAERELLKNKSNKTCHKLVCSEGARADGVKCLSEDLKGIPRLCSIEMQMERASFSVKWEWRERKANQVF